MNGIYVDRKFIVEHHLGFVFRKISLPSGDLAYWFSVQEFLDEVESLIKQNKTVDNQVIYDIMLKVYEQKSELRKVSSTKPDFNYNYARRSIKHLRRVLDETSCDQQGFSNK